VFATSKCSIKLNIRRSEPRQDFGPWANLKFNTYTNTYDDWRNTCALVRNKAYIVQLCSRKLQLFTKIYINFNYTYAILP